MWDSQKTYLDHVAKDTRNHHPFMAGVQKLIELENDGDESGAIATVLQIARSRGPWRATSTVDAVQGVFSSPTRPRTELSSATRGAGSA